MTADLTPAQAARLEAIEAAPYAEEAWDELCRLVYDGVVGQWIEGTDIRRLLAENFDPRPTVTKILAVLAPAAIDVMRGATDDGAVGRVLALADDLDAEARSVGYRVSPAAAATARYAAASIRGAVGAPATAEGDDRG